MCRRRAWDAFIAGTQCVNTHLQTVRSAARTPGRERWTLRTTRENRCCRLAGCFLNTLTCCWSKFSRWTMNSSSVCNPDNFCLACSTRRRMAFAACSMNRVSESEENAPPKISQLLLQVATRWREAEKDGYRREWTHLSLPGRAQTPSSLLPSPTCFLTVIGGVLICFRLPRGIVFLLSIT